MTNSLSAELHMQIAAIGMELKSHSAAIAELRTKISALSEYLQHSSVVIEPIGGEDTGAHTKEFNLRRLSPACSDIYPGESNESGDFFRWTGPGATTILHLAINRSKSRVCSIEVASSISENAILKAKISVDGIEVASNITSNLIEFDIPQSHSSFNGLTRIDITPGETLRPKDISTSSDERTLGIAISKIAVHQQ